MTDLTRGERLQIMLTKKELEALDNWRFGHRMPSRAAAIRELLKRGLMAEGFTFVTDGSHSRCAMSQLRVSAAYSSGESNCSRWRSVGISNIWHPTAELVKAPGRAFSVCSGSRALLVAAPSGTSNPSRFDRSQRRRLD